MRTETENKRILKALSATKYPLTRRELSERSNLEIATLCRALFNLVYKRKTVHIIKLDYCKTTGRKVMHFAIIREGVKND